MNEPTTAVQTHASQASESSAISINISCQDQSAKKNQIVSIIDSINIMPSVVRFLF